MLKIGKKIGSKIKGQLPPPPDWVQWAYASGCRSHYKLGLVVGKLAREPRHCFKGWTHTVQDVKVPEQVWGFKLSVQEVCTKVVIENLSLILQFLFDSRYFTSVSKLVPEQRPKSLKCLMWIIIIIIIIIIKLQTALVGTSHSGLRVGLVMASSPLNVHKISILKVFRVIFKK